MRADAGYFAAELAHTALGLGCDFAVAAKRNPAMWRAAAGVPEQDWSPAIGMHAAQVAVVDYAPAGWPPHTYTLIRRVRVDAEQISTDPRSRRRRTIDRDQLTLALDGQLDHAWATSFIVTNLPTGGESFDTAAVGVPPVVLTRSSYASPLGVRRQPALIAGVYLRRRGWSGGLGVPVRGERLAPGPASIGHCPHLHHIG